MEMPLTQIGGFPLVSWLSDPLLALRTDNVWEFLIRLDWLLSSLKLEPENARRKQGGRGLNTYNESDLTTNTEYVPGASSLSFTSSA